MTCSDHPWLERLQRFDGDRFAARRLVNPYAVLATERSGLWDSLAWRFESAHHQCSRALFTRVNPPDTEVAGVHFLSLDYAEMDGFLLRAMAACVEASAAIAGRCQLRDRPSYSPGALALVPGLAEYHVACVAALDAESLEPLRAVRVDARGAPNTQYVLELMDAMLTGVMFYRAHKDHRPKDPT